MTPGRAGEVLLLSNPIYSPLTDSDAQDEAQPQQEKLHRGAGAGPDFRPLPGAARRSLGREFVAGMSSLGAQPWDGVGGKNQPSETLRLLLFCAFWGKMSQEKLGLRYEITLKNRNMGNSGDFSGCGSGTGVSHGNKMI